MPKVCVETEVTEAEAERLAERIALKIAKGDCLALFGDLGAGKTTFARALIRAVLGDDEAEVPSPTFSLVQTYETARLTIAHLDLYRLSSEDEIDELGLDDYAKSGALIIEWPERAPSVLSENRLEIRFTRGSTAETRSLRIEAFGTWEPRLRRAEAIGSMLAASKPWSAAHARYLQGDASARAYARLWAAGKSAVLMDQPRQPDGPAIRNGLPYSRIAHLAEDVAPFVATARTLRDAGLSAPEIYEADFAQGLLILEDFGDRVFGAEVTAGRASQEELWRAGVETLVALARVPVPPAIPLETGTPHIVPRQDAGVLAIEVELLPDWYWPALFGSPCPAVIREGFLAAWQGIFANVIGSPDQGWVLRDYHSPNLVWLPDRDGPRRSGLLDFQDALHGHLAFDVVSLLQDARLDVPPDLAATLLDAYCAARRGTPNFDESDFRFATAALGAQRNTKILGIFARLAKRDKKPQYLAHIPRIWRYVEICLAHPGLAPLKSWFDTHIPAALRARPLSIS